MKEQLKVGQVFKNYKTICEWLDVEPSTGKSKQLHIKDFERYCAFHKEGQKFIIDEVFDEPKDKIDKRKYISSQNTGFRKDYAEYMPKPSDDVLKGVYAIVKDNNIYIGSTYISFRNRFISHKNGKQKHTKTMISEGSLFQILWVSDVDDEYLIRQAEQMYIDYFMANPDWTIVNRQEETVCLSEKTKYKKKIIKVDERQYELALNILNDNGILIGGAK